MTPLAPITLAALRTRIGATAHSSWRAVRQEDITAFARLTGDMNPLHVDAGYAATTPFGSPIAHGFLTLSLLAAMSYEVIPDLAGQKLGVNYGFDRLRFTGPVPAGARVRGAFTLTALDEGEAGAVTSTYDVTVEVENTARPALRATWLQRRYL